LAVLRGSPSVDGVIFGVARYDQVSSSPTKLRAPLDAPNPEAAQFHFHWGGDGTDGSHACPGTEERGNVVDTEEVGIPAGPIDERRTQAKDGITLCDPNRASEGADKVFQRIYERAI